GQATRTPRWETISVPTRLLLKSPARGSLRSGFPRLPHSSHLHFRMTLDIMKSQMHRQRLATEWIEIDRVFPRAARRSLPLRRIRIMRKWPGVCLTVALLATYADQAQAGRGETGGNRSGSSRSGGVRSGGGRSGELRSMPRLNGERRSRSAE